MEDEVQVPVCTDENPEQSCGDLVDDDVLGDWAFLADGEAH
ncbi:hypothetical protein ACFWDN_13285 [Micromonospora chalcea]